MTPAERIARAVLNAYNRAGGADTGVNAAIQAAQDEIMRMVPPLRDRTTEKTKRKRGG